MRGSAPRGRRADRRAQARAGDDRQGRRRRAEQREGQDPLFGHPQDPQRPDAAQQGGGGSQRAPRPPPVHRAEGREAGEAGPGVQGRHQRRR